MNILIIGDNPEIIGGVVNYTRPLSLGLKNEKNNIHYLYSVAATGRFDFGSVRIKSSYKSGIHFHELINGEGLVFNYDNLAVDTGSWFSENFSTLISNHDIDVIHINEIFGFSSAIISVAKSMNVKVVITVHEYWWLCPHKVMVDFNGRVCEGPSDLIKCTHCVERRMSDFPSSQKSKLRFKFRNVFPRSFSLLSNLRQKLFPKLYSKPTRLSFGTEQVPKESINNKFLRDSIEERLRKNVEYMNKADIILCVSNDVKKILSKYGVNSSICKVNHIGSLVAEKVRVHKKSIDERKVIFGFIGGVGYYKGVHLMIEAFLQLSLEEQRRSILDIYGAADPRYLGSMMETIRQSELPEEIKSNITFHGRYTPDDIANIFDTIDISILPSLCADTAPQTIFESFSNGLPIIAPKIGGFPDFVKDDSNGYLFECGNPISLAEKMQKILAQPKKLDIFKKNFPKNKRMDDHVKEINLIYRDLIN